MNYKKIYQSFISSRAAKQSALVASGAYFESHHIKPKALGGSDDPENLIKLTPEDHYFAHLLLAKIHGGSMWFAVQAMGNLPGNSNFSEPLKKRVKFGHVRKAIAKNYRTNYSGENAFRADSKIYTLRNFDGREESDLRVNLREKTGLDTRAISALIEGSKKSYKGWYYPDKNKTGETRNEAISRKLSSNEVFNLYHHDGSVFVGTRKEFKDKFGVRLFFTNKRKSCYGWYRSKEEAESHRENTIKKALIAAAARGRVDGLSNPNADNRKYEFENEKTGEVVRMTRVELRDNYGLKTSQVTGVVSGTQISAGDWKLKGAKRKRAKRK